MTSGGTQQTTVLADNILSLHFRYFDGQRRGESWDSPSLPRGRQLPVAVAIQIQMAAPGGRPMDFATQVTLPMAIQQWGNSCERASAAPRCWPLFPDAR